jgi:hypothetical protein
MLILCPKIDTRARVAGSEYIIEQQYNVVVSQIYLLEGNMLHPLTKIAPKQRKAIFWTLFGITILLMLALGLLGGPLNTPQAPYGIVSFELAGDVQKSTAMVASWEIGARSLAGFNLGLDYLYMVVYSTTIAMACLWSGELINRQGYPGARLGPPLAWGQWGAALFDALENAILLAILLGGVGGPWPMLARICALLKFGLIFIGLVYSFLGVIVWFSRR